MLMMISPDLLLSKVTEGEIYTCVVNTHSADRSDLLLKNLQGTLCCLSLWRLLQVWYQEMADHKTAFLLTFMLFYSVGTH